MDSAQFVIDQTAGWIRHADAKVGILSAAAVVVAGFLVVAVPGAVEVVRASTVWSGLVAFLGLASFIAAVATAYFIVRAIVARTGSTSPGNRFSWPDLASAGWPNGTSGSSDEAKQQAVHLARLAAIKFQNFNRAFYVFVGLLALSSLTAIVVSIAES